MAIWLHLINYDWAKCVWRCVCVFLYMSVFIHTLKHCTTISLSTPLMVLLRSIIIKTPKTSCLFYIVLAVGLA